MDTIEKKIFFITSNTSKFTKKLVIDPTSDFTNVCITHMGIPKSFYMVEEDVKLTLKEGSKEVSLTFPRGNYSSTSVSVALEIFLNDKLANQTTGDYIVTPPFSANDVFAGLAKFKITVSGGSGISSLRSSGSDLSRLLGFNVTNVYTPFNSSGVWFSQHVVNFQKHPSIALMSDIVEGGVLQVVNTENNPYNSSIIYSSSDLFLNSKKLFKRSTNIYTFHLSSATDLGSSINLNGGFYSFELVLWKIGNPSNIMTNFFHYIYKKDQNSLLKPLDARSKKRKLNKN